MTEKPISSRGVTALLEQVCRLTHSTGHAAGLYPAQWTALRYFAEIDPAARTSAGLSRFQGMSLGPVARTIRTLVDKGLLERQPNPRSRRADLIELTPAGHALLDQDPLRVVAVEIDGLPEARKQALAEALETILSRLFQYRLAAGTALPTDDVPDGSEMS